MIVVLTDGRSAFKERDDGARNIDLRLRIIESFCHDIRQPLTAAMLRATALSERSEQVDRRASLRELQASLHEIATTSETVFDAIRLSRAEIRAQVNLVAIRTLFGRLDSTFRPQAESKGLKIRFVSHRIAAETDERLLMRLIQNLISNALKYTDKGSILVTCRRSGGSLILEVRDSGPGITVEVLRQMSSSAAEADTSLPPMRAGQGIGLWISREFALILRASLQIASGPGQGTSVRLTMPCAVIRQRQDPSEHHPAAPGQRRSVMILKSIGDDSVRIETIFIERGWICSVFDNVLRFLAAINTPGVKPDVVFVPARHDKRSTIFLLRIISSRFASITMLVNVQDEDDLSLGEISQLDALIVYGQFDESDMTILC